MKLADRVALRLANRLGRWEYGFLSSYLSGCRWTTAGPIYEADDKGITAFAKSFMFAFCLFFDKLQSEIIAYRPRVRVCHRDGVKDVSVNKCRFTVKSLYRNCCHRRHERMAITHFLASLGSTWALVFPGLPHGIHETDRPGSQTGSEGSSEEPVGI